MCAAVEGVGCVPDGVREERRSVASRVDVYYGGNHRWRDMGKDHWPAIARNLSSSIPKGVLICVLKEFKWVRSAISALLLRPLTLTSSTRHRSRREDLLQRVEHAARGPRFYLRHLLPLPTVLLTQAVEG